MIRVIQHNCARSLEWTITALETGDECREDVVCLQEPQKEIGAIRISHSAYEIRNRKRLRTAMTRVSGLVVDHRTDFSRGANDDIIHTAIRDRAETITRIVRIYNQRNM